MGRYGGAIVVIMRKSAAILVLLVAVTTASSTPLRPTEAYVLKNGLETWINTGDHLWQSASLAIGDTVTLRGETRTFQRDAETDEYARVGAPRGGDWVKAKYLCAGSSLAVVKADRATLYDGPQESKKTQRYVSYMTVVAILPEEASAGFVKIKAYDRVQKILIEDFARTNDLTTTEGDVRAAVLYITAIDTPPKRLAVLNSALSQYPQTIFAQAIRLAVGGAAAVGRESEPADGTFVVTEDNVNVRSAPDEKNGFVIDRLGKGARVHVTEKTKGTYTVAGDTAPWFHLLRPDGWMFGHFLSDAPSIWALAPGVRLDWRIIIALTRIDMHMLAEYDFRTDPDTGWLPLMICFPVSDLSGPWIVMETALNGRDILTAMRKAEQIAIFAAKAGLTAGAADIARVVALYAEKSGDGDTVSRMSDFIASQSGRLSNSLEFNREVPEALLALKPGTLMVGGQEDVRALGFPEVGVRIANMLDLLLKDMNNGPGLAVCTKHPDMPEYHKVGIFKKLMEDLRTDIEGVANYMNEENLEPAVWIASYINGAWLGACASAKGYCGTLQYATNYKDH